MDASSKIQGSIHDVRLTYKYVSRILGTYHFYPPFCTICTFRFMHLHYHILCIVSSFCTVFSLFPSFLYFSLTFFVHYLYYFLLFSCILCILFLHCIVCNSCILCYTISEAYKYNIKGVYYEMYHSKYC